MDESGKLYGNIGPGNYFGIGAIGELSPGSTGWTYTDLANFNPTVGYFLRLLQCSTKRATCSAQQSTVASFSLSAGPPLVVG